jgi:hypothetical protein
VVLPDPEGPSIEKNSPCGISRSRSETAVMSPKILFRPLKLTAEVFVIEEESWRPLAVLTVKISPSQSLDVVVARASPEALLQNYNP